MWNMALHEAYLLLVAPAETPHRTIHVGVYAPGDLVSIVEVLYPPQAGEELQELVSGHPIFEGELTRQVTDHRADGDAVFLDVHS